MARFRDILRNKSFFRLWTSQVISNFGDRLNQIALIALVYRKAPGSTVELAKVVFFIVIPVFIIGPIAGVYVDRWDRKRVMIISDIVRAVLVLLIPFMLTVFTSFIPIYAIIFLIFSTTRFFLPSKMAIIPDIVPPEMLLLANTLADSTRMIATFVGFGLAGIIVERIGAVKAFYIDSLTYLVSALLIGRMIVGARIADFRQDIVAAGKVLGSALRKSVISEIREGMHLLISNPSMRFVIRMFFFLMAGAGALSCVLIVFIQKAFGSVTKDLSILIMFLGLGALIGAMLYGRFGMRFPKKKAIPVCMLCAGLCTAIFAVATHSAPFLWVSALLMFLMGIGAGPTVICLNTMIHETVPQEARGRVFSAVEAVIHLAFLVCMFFTASIAELIDSVWILAACGALVFGWGLAELSITGTHAAQEG